MALPSSAGRPVIRCPACSRADRWSERACASVPSVFGWSRPAEALARRLTRLMPNSRYNTLPKMGASHASPIQATLDPASRLVSSTCTVTPTAKARCNSATSSRGHSGDVMSSCWRCLVAAMRDQRPPGDRLAIATACQAAGGASDPARPHRLCCSNSSEASSQAVSTFSVSRATSACWASRSFSLSLEAAA